MSSFSGRLSHPKPEGRQRSQIGRARSATARFFGRVTVPSAVTSAAPGAWRIAWDGAAAVSILRAYWTTSSPARSNGHGGIVSQRANRAYARFARVRLTRWSATMRISACGAFRQWLNKLGLDVPGKWSTRHNRRPKFQRRGLDQTTVERHHVQVVVQKGPASTVTSVTGQPYSGSTLTPMADTADVRARRIGEEDIGALVPTLGSALESPTSSRERGKVGIVIYRDQHVGIFRIMLVSDQ